MLTEDNRVPVEHVDAVCAACEESVATLHGCMTLVTWRMPNGFVLVEHSGCIDPRNYSEELGADICRKRLRDKVWELEGYVAMYEFAARTGEGE